MAQIKVIPIVKKVMQDKYVSPAELARRLAVSPATVQGMLTRPTLQVGKLIQISEVLHYNFFREIAATLPIAEPNYEVDNTAPLLEKIKALEMEIGILRQTLKDLVSRP
jgi:hypothetical protein